MGKPVLLYTVLAHALTQTHQADWIMLLTDGLVILLVVLFKEETLAPRLLKYKAYYFRKITADNRFRSEGEVSGDSTLELLKTRFSLPFVLALEPIVIAFTLYLTIIYIILFTYLDGYVQHRYLHTCI